MALKKRRTWRTDANGNLLDEYKGTFELEALAAARKAGIPERLLDPAGWDGDEDDLTGYYADLIYRLGQLPIKGPLPPSDAEKLIQEMVGICERFEVDWHKAVPFDYPRLIRSIRQGRAEQEAINQGTWIPPVRTEAEIERILPGW